MIPRQKWVDHQFNLGIDIGWMHNILSRAQDAGIRIAHHCQALSEAALIHQPNGKWSIKEHIGHLIDLEDVHSKRLEEFAAFKEVLTGADMSNTKTKKADHNQKKISDLITTFNSTRAHFIQQFLSLNEKCQYHQAMHPRLKILMKPVDMLFFVCEHDDQHIASMVKNAALFKAG